MQIHVDDDVSFTFAWNLKQNEEQNVDKELKE